MPGVHTFYDGSKILEPIAERIGIEVDMMNLVFCQFLSVPLAIFYRVYLSHTKVSRTVRLVVPLVLGLMLCYFCYGSAIKHPMSMILISYSIMRFSPTKYVHKLIFIFSMGYLIFIHWFRWYILTSYSIDITGPMMVLTQKVTTMAFSLHDGRVKKVEELTDIQKRDALSEVPSLLDYLSYLFHFQTVLTGPLCFYSDYQSFINGTNMTEKERAKSNVSYAVLPKLLFSLVCMVIIAVFQHDYYPELIIEEESFKLPFYLWWSLFFWVIILKRIQYYYAWIWADVVTNLSGFGFNGYDEEGKEKWDLVSNVNPWKVETAFSFKETLDNWNCTTMYWLRRVAYERVPKNYQTVATYLLSALWHGLFFGYYLTFFTGALFTVASHTARRCLRHRFQHSKKSRIFYDIITFLATKCSLAYATFPFVTLHFNPGFFVYKKLYFCWHLVALFGIFILPRILSPEKRISNNKKK